MNQSSYRPDIDGLRALAVLAVVAFHAFPEWVGGGFAGVDVFFVISGFLITSIIVRDLQQERFRFADFYSRRIRRIFPALATVLLFCLVAGWFDMLADEFRALGRQVAAGTAFISNWILLKEAVENGGYFDTAAELKPLLHLWSLGIEEQFYILWPPICIFAYRRRWPLVRVALALAAASFVLNLGLLPHFKEATFYLPWTRLWELLCGCALAVSSLRPLGLRTRSIISCLGFVLIAVAVFSFNGSQPFPGWRAALPVVGSVLLIWSEPGALVNRLVLSWRPLVGVGLISYPLYLWHWPLLAFARLGTVARQPLPVGERLLLIALSFFLAWLTYVVLEKFVRTHKVIFRWPTVAVLVAVVLVIGVSGKVIVAVRPHGWLYQHQGQEQDLGSLALDADLEALTTEGCGLNKAAAHDAMFCRTERREGAVNAVVYGDSRAHAIFSGLVAASTADQRWLMVSQPGCAPLMGFDLHAKINEAAVRECQRLNAATPLMLGDHPEVRTVLLAMAARVVEATRLRSEAPSAQDPVLEGLVRTIDTLQAQNKRVVFLIDNPHMIDPHRCLQRFWSRWNQEPVQSCGITRAQHDAQYSQYKTFLTELRRRVHHVEFLDPIPALCSDEFCSVLHGEHFLYADEDHYSDFGAHLIAQRFAPQLRPPALADQ